VIAAPPAFAATLYIAGSSDFVFSLAAFVASTVSCTGLVLCPVMFVHGILALRHPPAAIERRGELIGALVVGLLPLAAVLGIILLRYL
jgi:hypothetical protein